MSLGTKEKRTNQVKKPNTCSCCFHERFLEDGLSCSRLFGLNGAERKPVCAKLTRAGKSLVVMASEVHIRGDLVETVSKPGPVRLLDTLSFAYDNEALTEEDLKKKRHFFRAFCDRSAKDEAWKREQFLGISVRVGGRANERKQILCWRLPGFGDIPRTNDHV